MFFYLLQIGIALVLSVGSVINPSERSLQPSLSLELLLTLGKSCVQLITGKNNGLSKLTDPHHWQLNEAPISPSSSFTLTQLS